MFRFFVAINFLFFSLIINSVDYAVVGYYEPADGIGQISGCFNEALNQLGRSYFINTLDQFVPPNDSSIPKNTQYYDAIFFVDMLERNNHKPLKKLPNNYFNLKIAYSMFETDEIPVSWVRILNEKFDAVIVPDIFLKNVYEESGVVKPIFVIPAPINTISDFKLTFKKITNKFIFLYSSTFSDRKNQITLLKAFKEKFANNSGFELILHGRKSDKTLESITMEIQESNLKNVKIIDKKINRKEYVELFQNASCYVSPSKGEGFAIPPREALAAGLPVILTDCSAQSSLCQNNFFISVPADIKEDCYYESFKENIGKCRNCRVSDLADAMEKVAQNYNYYYKLAQANRFWAYNFSTESLKNKLEYFLFYDLFSDYKSAVMSKEQARNFKIFLKKLEKVRFKYFAS